MVDELEVMMQKRATPKAPPELAERIIARARMQPSAHQNPVAAGWMGLENLLDNLLLPRPQWAFGFVLALGIALGMNIGQSSAYAQDDGAQELSAVFDIEDNPNPGEFL